jgi:predicted NBD/HSP70 family sugar kinase
VSVSQAKRPTPIETMTQVRRASVSAILAAFWDGQPHTINDLLARVGLTRATAHSVCNELVDRGWIREQPQARRGAGQYGRPAKLFQLERQARYLLGLDLSRQHLSAIVADLAGETVYEEAITLADTSEPGTRDRQIGPALEQVLRGAKVTRERLLVAAIGVALPVSRDGTLGQGEALDSTAGQWRTIRSDIDSLRAGLPGLPVLCANDAHMALIGERWRGVAAGVDNLVVILGTEVNVGSAVMEAGRTLYGHTGGMGELYWQTFKEGPDAEGGIAQLVNQEAASPKGRRTAPASDPNDPDAQPTVQRIATTVADTVRTMAIMLNPELVVLAGAAPQWRDVIAPHVSTMIERDVHDPPRVVSSNLGEAVVAIGAVRHALDHLHENALDIDLRAAHGSP